MIKAVFSFSSGLIIARGLGPKEFGVLSFLLSSFVALRSLLDMGTSNAFFSFISKKNQSKKFILSYLFWLLVQFTLSILFIGLIAPNDWILSIWQGEVRERILLAFVAVFFQQQVWGMLSHIGESQRLTFHVQSINVVVSVVHLIVIFGLYVFDELSIERIFALITIEFLLATLVAWWLFQINFSSEVKTFRQIIEEYKIFCTPLFLFTYLGFAVNFADTWMLQHYGGAVEQAYYGIGHRFSVISLLVTSSVLGVLWKEVSESNERGDTARVYRIYEFANRALFMLGAFISGFLIPWASEIIQLILGDEYMGGVFVLALMFFYPVHQSLGQLSGTMYYALELTKPYAIIGMINMSLSLILVYFLLASENAIIPGLNLASTGLAMKMVVLQIFSVNFSIWWLTKSQGWKFTIIYQFIGMSSFIIAGFTAKVIVSFFLWNESLQLLQFILTGLFYIVLSGVIIYSMPWLLNMTRNEIKQHVLSAKGLVQ